MTSEMRKSGIDVVGDMPWGTHICLFYESGSPRHVGLLLQGWIGKPRVLPVGGGRAREGGRGQARVETSRS